MHCLRASLGWTFIAFLWAVPALGQNTSVSEKLLINASSASTWSTNDASVIQLDGPVSIDLDEVRLSAKQAVIWLTPSPGGLLGEQQADIVLLGDAKLTATDNHVTRSGPELLVSALARGAIQLITPNRVAQDLSTSSTFLQAQIIRDAAHGKIDNPSSGQPPVLTTTAVPPPAPLPGTSVTSVIQPKPSKRGTIQLSTLTGFTLRTVQASDGTEAFQLTGNFGITDSLDDGSFREFQADNAILFTSIPWDRRGPISDLGRDITAAYLEGDVRLNNTSPAAKVPEERLTADRIYYDFKTDRAILTGVVMHTIDPMTQIPIIFRAQKMRQLAQGEFEAEKVDLTTSEFAVPTYAIRANYAYIHENPRRPGDYDFVTHDDVFKIWGQSVFYTPVISGNVNNDPFPLREFNMGSSRRFGFTETSRWGVFETLGEEHPKDLDLSYELNYYESRGAGAGFNGDYKGGFITDSDDPWNFEGDFKAFFMYDKGVDELGGVRDFVKPPTDVRGRFLYEHEHFFPDDWQVQVRLGYVTDPTFLEQYYQSDFDTTLPYNASFYVKRQRDDEVLTFVAETDTSNFTTNSDRQQEQFDVARLPEISYQRIGDSIADDQLTFFSNNSASALQFQKSSFTLAQQGFPAGISPGLPSDGFTGTTGKLVYRGDSRQEVDWPFAIGDIKMVPYVMGRVTSYSDSPENEVQSRFLGGVGLRMTSSFWRIYDNISSDLFDIHRLRHIIQPEINLFTSATTLDQSKLYIFDPNVDAVNAINAATVALHQHWETMRGGPGRWQSVDLLDFNIEGDFYGHQPPPSILNPVGFRGLFFSDNPESSVPRQAVNADATLHIGDNTSFITDAQYNLDTKELAIIEGGISVARGSRLSYYVGDAYVQALHSQVFSLNANYNLTSKYAISVGQSFDFGPARDVNTGLTVTRRFDSFALQVTVYHDGINNDSGFNINFLPVGQPGFSLPWGVND